MVFIPEYLKILQMMNFKEYPTLWRCRFAFSFSLPPSRVSATDGLTTEFGSLNDQIICISLSINKIKAINVFALILKY